MFKDLETLNQMITHMSLILDRRQKKRMIRLIIITIAGALLDTLGVSVMLPFIKAMMNPQSLLDNKYIYFAVNLFGFSGDFGILLLVGVGVCVVYTLKNLFLLFATRLQTAYCADTQRELSVLMLRSYVNRPYSFFVNNNSGKILRGVKEDVLAVFNVLLFFFRFISELMVVILVAVYLLIIDVGLALGVLCAGIVSLLIVVLIIKRRVTVAGRVNHSANAETNRWVMEIVTGIKDILIYDKKDYFTSNYEKSYRNSAKASAEYTFLTQCPERVIEGICVVGIMVTILIRIKTGVDVEVFVPKMAVFAMGAFRLLPLISRIGGDVNVFIYSRPSVEAAYENIKEAKEHLGLISNEINKKDETKYIEFSESISIEKLKWRYENSDEDVLKEINLTINKGEAIGIIGESGAGKSTLADLLLHLYRPKAGVIKMDGVDINAIPHAWGKCIGYVPQTVFLVDGSVRDNVAFGEADADDERVWAALKEASLMDFVEQMPHGLDTLVGERGVKFSGGQRQRIAIARALYRNPQILILDEATSALDNDTEHAVIEAIDNLHGDVTLLIIAHRLTTIRNCDRIYEITGGKAVERIKEEVLA